MKRTLITQKMAIEELDRAESIISDYLAYVKPEMEKKETIDVKKAAD